MNKRDNFALVPRQPSAVEKAEPGAKRILSCMVADALALAKKVLPAKTVFTVLIGAPDMLDIVYEKLMDSILGQQFDLRFLHADEFYMGGGEQLLRLAEENPFDLIILYSRLGYWEMEQIERLRVQYGKPILATSGSGPIRIPADASRADIHYLSCPFSLKQLRDTLESCLKTSVATAEKAGKIVPQPSRRRPRIVVVNDIRMCLETFEAIIQLLYKECTVLLFDDGEEAWAELLRDEPDLLITDLNRPGLSGWQLLGRLNSRKVMFPILVTSGVANSNEDRVRYCAGADLNVIVRQMPITPKQLRHDLLTLVGPSDMPATEVRKATQ